MSNMLFKVKDLKVLGKYGVKREDLKKASQEINLKKSEERKRDRKNDIWDAENMRDSKEGRKILFDMIESGNLEGIEKFFTISDCLYRNKNDILNGTSNRHGWSPLHHAVYYGALDIVKYLVEIGADLKVIDGGGFTPYDLSLDLENKEIADYLNLEMHKKSKCFNCTCAGDGKCDICMEEE